MDIFEVRISTRAKDDLQSVPAYIAFKLQSWVDGVKNAGLHEMLNENSDGC